MKQTKSTKRKPQAKANGRKNKASGGGFFSRVEAYRDQHAHALFSSLGRMVASPFASIVTVVVLAITISLAGGFYMLVVNLQQLTGSMENSNQISLFLKDNITEAKANEFADDIKQNTNVQSVSVISKEKAWLNLKPTVVSGQQLTHWKSIPCPSLFKYCPRIPWWMNKAWWHCLTI